MKGNFVSEMFQLNPYNPLKVHLSKTRQILFRVAGNPILQYEMFSSVYGNNTTWHFGIRMGEYESQVELNF